MQILIGQQAEWIRFPRMGWWPRTAAALRASSPPAAAQCRARRARRAALVAACYSKHLDVSH